MQYREIVAVTGLGGLYQLLSTKSDGAIVRSLGDNSTKFISSRQHQVTPLESIEIYTTGNNVRLHEVLQQMQESDAVKPDGRQAKPEDIRGYFREIFPEIDEDRVYTSDMKKMLKWFDILQGAGLLDFSAMTAAADAAPADEDAEVTGDAGPEEDASAMPAEGEAQVAEHDKGGDTEVPLAEDGGEQPAKKVRAKKAAAPAVEGEEAPKKPAKAKKTGEGE